jgi:hypothetical protein
MQRTPVQVKPVAHIQRGYIHIPNIIKQISLSIIKGLDRLGIMKSAINQFLQYVIALKKKLSCRVSTPGLRMSFNC